MQNAVTGGILGVGAHMALLYAAGRNRVGWETKKILNIPLAITGFAGGSLGVVLFEGISGRTLTSNLTVALASLIGVFAFDVLLKM
jgi:hypothetical protein